MLRGKKTLVVGLGKTGLATARFLKREGALVTATDAASREKLKGVEELDSLGVVIEAAGHTRDTFLSADLIVVSPGVDSRKEFFHEAEKRGIPVISDVELFFRLVDIPIVAITGTNGKSTTTELISAVLRSSGMRVFTGGNIGTPVMEYFGRGAADAAVLEISSFHLERSPTFRPRIAALLNITEDHLCRHGSFGEYAETKLRIFANQKESDWAVVNAGDPTVERALRDWRFSSAVVPFSAYSTLKDGLYLNGPCVEWRSGGRKEFYGMADAKLEGIHNMENIMATIAVCVLLGAGKENILKTTRSFRGLPHRMEFIREVDGVRYINDSKSTNVGSLLKALEGINGKAVVIAGGEDKGGDYAVLKELVREKVKLLVLIGRAKEKIKDALSGSTEAVTAGSLEEAVALARERASSGEAVILSPACASFDMFRNFEERGERFRTLVERL